MNQRYQNAEIEAVREKYADNELYRAVCSIGLTLEAELTGFGLCPEECFTEVLEILSAIADVGDAMHQDDLDEMWLRKYNEYMRLDRHVDGDIIGKAVGIVFGFAALAVDSSSHPFYRYTLARELTEIVCNHKFDGWEDTLDKIFEVPLPDGWFDRFVGEEPEGESDGLPLPGVLNTNRAQEYFQKAIDKGFIKVENKRFSWIGIGKSGYHAQLAYFCGRVYEYKHSATGNHGAMFPEDELMELFGVKRLYYKLTQAHNAQRKQSWRACIDELFT